MSNLTEIASFLFLTVEPLKEDLDIDDSILKSLIEDVSQEYEMLVLDEAQQKSSLERLASEAAYIIVNADWSLFAGRVLVQALYMESGSYGEYLYDCRSKFGDDFYKFVNNHREELENMLDETRDMRFDYFAMNTLKRAYLWQSVDPVTKEKRFSERPQYMYMRVAVQLWYPDMKKIKETYDELSAVDGVNPLYTHASPTLFNSGSRRPQLASCFLMSMGDSIEAIAKTWHDCAIISKNSGGIGIDISDIRHSEISTGRGESGGTTPMLKTINAIVKYVNQGGNRPGSCAVYMPCWHKDIFGFLELRKNTGSDYLRARDLFLALWVSDLFMKRVFSDGVWTLFCPNKAKGLNDVYGLEFETRYLKYEKEDIGAATVKARDVWKQIHISRIETSMPYVCFKDNVNRKNNQENLGTIRCSNLCTEIALYTSPEEIASCNLASICLDSHVSYRVKGKKVVPYYDYPALVTTVRKVTRNINQVIDRNYYPENVPEIKYSNLKNRPLGIGVQGLADTFAKLDLSFTCDEAKKINKLIFESIYYGFVSESVEISKERHASYSVSVSSLKSQLEQAEHEDDASLMMSCERQLSVAHDSWEGGWYKSFYGSPASRGLFSFDLWESETLEKKLFFEKNFKNISDVKDMIKVTKYTSDMYDWEKLRKEMKEFGMWNSVGVALMPTASTAQINRRTEAFEPFGELISTRTVLSGQYLILNRYMISDLQDIEMWNTETLNSIIHNCGSISKLEPRVPEVKERLEHLKEKYRNAYEIPQKDIVQMNLDRCPFVDQTTSFNVHMRDPTYKKMTSLLFMQWLGGAKTGIYYLRSKPASQALNIAFESLKQKYESSVDEEENKKKEPVTKELPRSKTKRKVVCTEDVCIMCQS